MSTNSQSRRFAPLNVSAEADGAMRLRGIVFDMDGTLCKDFILPSPVPYT